jgi:hypothetical protein
MTLPLYPFFCLGLGVLLPRLYEKLFWLFSWNERDINKALFVFVLVYYPLGAVVVYDINSFVYGKGLARGDERILSDIVLFLDKNTEKEDVVLSTSHISRLVKARGAELYQGLAAEGDTISYFGKKLPPSRFLFNSSYKRAKYVVLHEGTLDWLSDNMSKVNVSSELGSWPVVYRRGEFVVYRNPHLQNESAVEDKPRPKG